MEPTDFEKRSETFRKEYGELVARHKIDFMSIPVYQPDEKGVWHLSIQTQCMDLVQQPIKSPFVPEK